MDHISKSFPQGFPPAPPSQSAKAEILELDIDLDVRVKRKIVKSTGLVRREWLPWHCSVITRLGPDVYLDIAEAAKRSKYPEKLFSWMLKAELEDLEQNC